MNVEVYEVDNSAQIHAIDMPEVNVPVQCGSISAARSLKAARLLTRFSLPI